MGSLLHFWLYSSLRALFFTLGSLLHFGLSSSLRALFVNRLWQFTYCVENFFCPSLVPPSSLSLKICTQFFMGFMDFFMALFFTQALFFTWILFFSSSSLLHCGLSSSLWALFFTSGSLLHFGLPSSLRAPFVTSGSFLQFGLPSLL